MKIYIAGFFLVAVSVSAWIFLWRQPEPADPVMARKQGETLLRTPGPVLAVAAHPDDLEYYAGGTLALLSRKGAAVIAVICTDGERGGKRPNLGQIRRGEQREAARILGYREVRFLGYADRGLSQTVDRQELVAALERIIEEVRPALILTFDSARPRPPYIHPDHQAVGRAVAQAVARLQWPGSLALFHTRRPDAVVDITPVAEEKLAALRAHQSQYDLAEATGMRRLLLRWLRFMGRRGRTGSPGGPVGPEAYRLLSPAG